MSQNLNTLRTALNHILIGKSERIDLVLSCLLAGGHLLLEDRPGTGKTLLSAALARLTGLEYRRLQCTNDMMPSDVVGTQVLDPRTQQFVLHQGPVFCQLLLADEINRATPKTQSALLEAMAEQQVSIDGTSLPLPRPFFVVATQNPTSHQGTFALPEAQLDRFMMRLSLGYAAAQDEVRILSGQDPRAALAQMDAVLDTDTLLDLQRQVAALHCSETLCAYVQRLLQHTRDCGEFEEGLSTRAGQALLAAARAHAFLNGDDFVMPAHVQTVFNAVTAHRLRLRDTATGGHVATARVIEQVAV
jgi:MoxR-like ATPase